MTAFLPDVLRGFERSYSRLADQASELLFAGATWFARGSWVEIGVKIGVVVAVLAALHFALGGATAMGDKRPAGPTIMWGGVAVILAVIAFVVFVQN
jgi:hypothetical protein